MTRPRLEPDDGDRRHLVSAIKDTSEGWMLHPFTCARFQALGWLDKSGWTKAAYEARNAYVKGAST